MIDELRVRIPFGLKVDIDHWRCATGLTASYLVRRLLMAYFTGQLVLIPPTGRVDVEFVLRIDINAYKTMDLPEDSKDYL